MFFDIHTGAAYLYFDKILALPQVQKFVPKTLLVGWPVGGWVKLLFFVWGKLLNMVAKLIRKHCMKL